MAVSSDATWGNGSVRLNNKSVTPPLFIAISRNGVAANWVRS
jgi:hypothetical protein